MARKLRFERVLDAPALFSVAYGEIASSLYFALGIVAGYALGLTPVVLLGAGVFFLLVSLSYAEGTAAIPEQVVERRGGRTSLHRRSPESRPCPRRTRARRSGRRRRRRAARAA